MENLSLVKLFLESKDRFINNLSTLSPEEKSKLIKFFRDHSNYENQIDWNNKNLTFADFEPLLNKQSKTLLKKEYKLNPRLMFSDSKNFMIYKETDDFLFVLPLTWEAAKFMDSSKCGGEGARWCIGDKNSSWAWDHYTNPDEEREFDRSAFVLLFNKHYDPSIYDGVEKDKDGFYDESNDLFHDGVICGLGGLKYMIQLFYGLDDPGINNNWGQDYLSDVFDINDHIVWYQDDRKECIMPLSWEQDLLSNDEIEEILEIFSKKAQFNELQDDDDY